MERNKIKYEWYALVEHAYYGCVVIKQSVKPTKKECREVVNELRMEDYVEYRKHRTDTEIPYRQMRWANIY